MFKKITDVFRSIVKKFRKTYSDDELREIIKTKGLHHIAIVPDGDRRWAREKGLNPSDGHKKAFLERVPALFEEVWRLGVHTATLSVLSPENWNRDRAEIDKILEFINTCLEAMLPIAKSMNVRMIHMGRKNLLPEYLLKTIEKVETETRHFEKHVFNFAIDYGSRNEMCRAVKKIISDEIGEKDITEDSIANALDTAQQPYPNPDFLIRSGKVCRLSGFMLWQAAYSELYFPQLYFPDFDCIELRKAIYIFGQRKRTFGAN